MSVEPVTVPTQAHVAQVFNVSLSAVEKWSRAGMPGEKGRYVLSEVYKWLQAREKARESERLSTREAVELKHAKVKLARDELKLEVERGNMVERALVEAELALRVTELTTSLDGLPHNQAARLAPAMEPRKVEEILRKAVHAFRERYARPLPEDMRRAPEEDDEAPPENEGKRKRGRKRKRDD